MPTAYVTAPPSAAEDIAEALVDRRVAACVNAIPCQSTFRWDGAVHDEEEVILLAKTTDERYADLVAAVEELHPYDVPCIERFEEDHVLESFGEWRADCVRE